ARGPDRPRHVRRDHGSAPGGPRRRPVRAGAAAAGARRRRTPRPQERPGFLRVRLTRTGLRAGFSGRPSLLSGGSSAMSQLPTPSSRYGQGRSPVLRILLVDDDPALRKLLTTTFEVADVDVVEAEDAEAARRQIRRARP